MKKILTLLFLVFVATIASAEEITISHNAPSQAIMDTELTVDITITAEMYFDVRVYDRETGDMLYEEGVDDPDEHIASCVIDQQYTSEGTRYFDIVVERWGSGILAEDEFSIEFVEELPQENQPPVIHSITATPTQGVAPLQVSFSLDVEDPDGDNLTYAWDFGDGGVSNLENPTHTYLNVGTYAVGVIVGDDEYYVSDNVTIRTLSRPTAAINGWSFVELGETLEYNSEDSTDSDGTIVEYRWTWDGEEISTDEICTITFDEAGPFELNLIVIDNDGLNGSDSMTINVLEPKPPFYATFTADATRGEWPLEVQFISQVDGGFPPYIYMWDFGDGKTSTEENPTHTFIKGYYFVTLTVEDDRDGIYTTPATLISALAKQIQEEEPEEPEQEPVDYEPVGRRVRSSSGGVAPTLTPIPTAVTPPATQLEQIAPEQVGTEIIGTFVRTAPSERARTNGLIIIDAILIVACLLIGASFIFKRD